MNEHRNPGTWARAGVKKVEKSTKLLTSASQKSPSQHRLIVRNADGSTEGADPFHVPIAELNAAGHVPGPMLAVIRAKCLDCSGGFPSEVRKCTAVGCVLWPYRIGQEPVQARSAPLRQAIHENHRENRGQVRDGEGGLKGKRQAGSYPTAWRQNRRLWSNTATWICARGPGKSNPIEPAPRRPAGSGTESDGAPISPNQKSPGNARHCDPGPDAPGKTRNGKSSDTAAMAGGRWRAPKKARGGRPPKGPGREERKGTKYSGPLWGPPLMARPEHAARKLFKGPGAPCSGRKGRSFGRERMSLAIAEIPAPEEERAARAARWKVTFYKIEAERLETARAELVRRYRRNQHAWPDGIGRPPPSPARPREARFFIPGRETPSTAANLRHSLGA